MGLCAIAPRSGIACLRDFFAAVDADGLARAYAGLAAAQEAPPAPESWSEAEFAFNRLFVGPGPLEAPPYASAYLEKEPRLYGRSTLIVKAVQDALGAKAHSNGCLPEDHISLELDTALALRALAREHPGNHCVAALRHYFLADRMGLWIPQFTDRIVLARAVPVVISFAAWKLRAWVEKEKAASLGYGEAENPAQQGERQ